MLLVNAFTGIFLPIILGILSRNGNFVHPEHRPVIQRFATRVAIPFMVFNSLRQIDLSTAGQFIPLSLSLFFFMGIIWLISWRLLILAGGHPWFSRYRAELLLMIYAGNIGHICWKLHEIMIGPAGLQRGIFYSAFYWPFLMAYAFATVFVFGLHKTHDLNRKEIACNLIPVLSMIAIGLIFGITETAIPDWLAGFTESFGNMGIPLTLYCLGLSISLRDAFKSTLSLLPYLVVRVILWVSLTVLMIRLPVYDGISAKVLIINSLSPLGIMPIVVSDMFGLDSEFVAHAITVSTVFFLIGLPVLVLMW